LILFTKDGVLFSKNVCLRFAINATLFKKSYRNKKNLKLKAKIIGRG